MYKHSLAVLCVATVALSGVVAPAATAAEDNGCKPGMISADFNWGVSKEFTDFLGRYRTLDGFTLKYNEGDVCPPLKPALRRPRSIPATPVSPVTRVIPLRRPLTRTPTTVLPAAPQASVFSVLLPAWALLVRSSRSS